MVSPISDRARGYVRSRATSVMEYECRAERVQPASYDETSLIATAGSRTVAYEGVCRIWEITGSAAVALGEVDIDMQSTQLSTPWDAPVLKIKDEIVITSAPTQDTAMLNKRFRITSTAFAGELRATRRYSVKAVEKK